MAKEMWDQRYSAEQYVYGLEPNLFLKESLAALPPGKLLLPAEGEGRNAVYAASAGWQVHAVDFSSEGRKKALNLAAARNVIIDYLLADITAHDFGEGIYDAVGLIFAHFPPGNRQWVHRKIARSLKTGGLLILEAFNKKQISNSTGGPKSLEMLYSIPMLSQDFQGFEILRLEEAEEHLDEGDGHNGQADLIRLLARKID